MKIAHWKFCISVKTEFINVQYNFLHGEKMCMLTAWEIEIASNVCHGSHLPNNVPCVREMERNQNNEVSNVCNVNSTPM